MPLKRGPFNTALFPPKPDAFETYRMTSSQKMTFRADERNLGLPVVIWPQIERRRGNVAHRRGCVSLNVELSPGVSSDPPIWTPYGTRVANGTRAGHQRNVGASGTQGPDAISAGPLSAARR
jgi:hypothetical protein